MLPPPPALAPFVSSFGYFEGVFPYARERVLPTGEQQLLINLADDELWWHPDGAPEQRTSGAVLQGASLRPGLIDPAHQRRIICVSFRPGGSYPFFTEFLAELPSMHDLLVPLEHLWGSDGATLRERLLNAGGPAGALRLVAAMLQGRAARTAGGRSGDAPIPDPAVAVAVRALHHGMTVAQVSDRLGRTPRWLTAWFGQRVGVSPKRFARVRRFQRLVAARQPEGRRDTGGHRGPARACCPAPGLGPPRGGVWLPRPSPHDPRVPGVGRDASERLPTPLPAGA